MITRRIIVKGRVQGVGFRAYTRREAQKLGLKGWVKNNDDGSVEALVTGPEDKVNALIEWARRGSPLARVDDLEVLEGTLDPSMAKDFSIVR